MNRVTHCKRCNIELDLVKKEENLIPEGWGEYENLCLDCYANPPEDIGKTVRKNGIRILTRDGTWDWWDPQFLSQLDGIAHDCSS